MEGHRNVASSVADTSEATPPLSEDSNDAEESVASPGTTSVPSPDTTTKSDQSEGDAAPVLQNREISSNVEPQVREAGSVSSRNPVNYSEMEAEQGGANSEATPAVAPTSSTVNPDSPSGVSSSTDPIVNEPSSTTLSEVVHCRKWYKKLDPDGNFNLPNLPSRNEFMENPAITIHGNDQQNLEQGVANLRIRPDNSSVGEAGGESAATSFDDANYEPPSQEQKDASNENNSLKPVTGTRVRVSPKRKSTGEFAQSQASTSASVSTETKLSNDLQVESSAKEQAAFFEKGKNIRKRSSPKSSPSKGGLKAEAEVQHHSPAKKPKPPPSEDADKVNPETGKKESKDDVGPIKKLKFGKKHLIAIELKPKETEKSEDSKTVVADNNAGEAIRVPDGQEDASETENVNKAATSETDSDSHDEEKQTLK